MLTQLSDTGPKVLEQPLHFVKMAHTTFVGPLHNLVAVRCSAALSHQGSSQ
jgi:hypothetical protein